MEAVLESQQNIKKARKEVENLIYKIMDILDPTNANSSWYKKKFASMSDNQFYEYFKQDFHQKGTYFLLCPISLYNRHSPISSE